MVPLGTIDPSVDRLRQRTADNLLRVHDREHDRMAIVHVEIERDWRPHMPGRLFEYASSVYLSNELPVWSVVVLLLPGGRPPKQLGEFRVPGIRDDAFIYRYQVVPLWELDARQMLDELGFDGIPFCAAMRGADEEFVEELTTHITSNHDLAPERQQHALHLLFAVSAVTLGAEAARTITQVESIMQDPNVQAFFGSFRNEGKAEGRIEGAVESRRQALYEVLAARSFTVPAELRGKIDQESDLARLSTWNKAAVTAVSIDDVFRDIVLPTDR